MMILPRKDYELIHEIKMSLPSSRIAAYATTLVIRHPKTNDLIILKWRLPWNKTEALQESDFIELRDRRTWNADWTDLIGENIILHPDMLNTRGLDALEKLSLNCDIKEMCKSNEELAEYIAAHLPISTEDALDFVEGAINYGIYTDSVNFTMALRSRDKVIEQLSSQLDRVRSLLNEGGF